MSSPNYDALHLRLSRMAGDTVTNATSDGNKATSALRDVILNNAIRVWITKKIGQPDRDGLYSSIDRDALRSYITNFSTTPDSNLKLQLSTFTYPVYRIIGMRDTDEGVTVFPIIPPLSRQSLAQLLALSLTASYKTQYWEADGGNLYILGGTAADTYTTEYVKQHTDLVAGGSAQTVVSDTAWSVSGTTVSSFTGVLSSHVGGQFVGIDSGGNKFVRTITSYISSTSFTIDTALVASGSGTNGYIIPLNAGDIQIDSAYFNEILDEALNMWKVEILKGAVA